MTMTRDRFLLSVAGVLAVAGVGGLGFASSRAANTDCPGKITCPLTGERICRDQCPTVDPNRPDCPGRIECPLDGELVCIDRCPLGEKSEAADQPLRACCGNGGT